MNKLKQFWTGIGAALVGLAALLAYLLTRKGEQVNAIKTKVALATTEKQSDLVEAEINQLKNNKDLNQKVAKALDLALTQLDKQRVAIKDTQVTITDPKAVKDYWDKN